MKENETTLVNPLEGPLKYRNLAAFSFETAKSKTKYDWKDYALVVAEGVCRLAFFTLIAAALIAAVAFIGLLLMELLPSKQGRRKL